MCKSSFFSHLKETKIIEEVMLSKNSMGAYVATSKRLNIHLLQNAARDSNFVAKRCISGIWQANDLKFYILHPKISSDLSAKFHCLAATRRLCSRPGVGQQNFFLNGKNWFSYTKYIIRTCFTVKDYLWDELNSPIHAGFS